MATLTTKDEQIQDLKAVISDAEQLLTNGTGQEGAQNSAIRARLTANLNQLKNTMSTTHKHVVNTANAAVKSTDEYVHDHPWGAVGIAAGVGFLIGLLVARR